MKNKLLLPAILFPYVVTCLFCSIFFLHVYDLFPVMFAALLFLPLVAVICSIQWMRANQTAEPTALMKAALKIKYLHIPAYLVIFLISLFLVMMIYMTTPLLLILVFTDVITLCLSDMLSIFAIVRSGKVCGAEEKAMLTFALICQFFFCLDVISLLLVKRKMKKKADAQLPAEP